MTWLKRIALMALLAFAAPAAAQVPAPIAIGNLPPASTPLSSADLLPISQNGIVRKATVAEFGSISTSVTLTGDCTGTSATGTVVTICLKTNGVSFGTAATASIGTSGASLGLLSGNLVFSGNDQFLGGVEIGSPTGGMPAGGALNAASLLVNNVAVLTGNQAITLSSDCSGTGATSISIICTKTNGVLFGTAAVANTGTSGATLGLLNGNLTLSGNDQHTGGLEVGTPTGGMPAAGVLNAGSILINNDVVPWFTGSLTSGHCVQLSGTTGQLVDSGSTCGGGGGGSTTVQSGTGVTVSSSPCTTTCTITLATIAADTVLGSLAGGVPGALSAANVSTILGLGTSATVNTGTSGATIPLNNGNLVLSGNDQFTGGVEIGTPTGGMPSAGILNAGSIKVNNVSVLTANQTITLTGDTTGSGTTAITTATGKFNGISMPGSIAAHQTMVATSSSVVAAKTIPDCQDAAGNHLNYTQSGDSFSCGTSSSGGGTGSNLQFFANAAASGTWTKPANVNSVYLRMCGAGGGAAGGGSGSSTDTGGAGGGAGGNCIDYTFRASDLGATVQVTLGAGGPGGAAATTGTAGAKSCFGGASACGGTPLLVAYGGGAGSASVGSTAGTGGSGGGILAPGNSASGGTPGGVQFGTPAGAAANGVGGNALFDNTPASGAGGGDDSGVNAKAGGNAIRGCAGGASSAASTSGGAFNGAAGGSTLAGAGGIGGTSGTPAGGGGTVSEAYFGGSGGGSGRTIGTGTAGMGGNGAQCAGGGAGGSAYKGTGGAGGAGGDGFALVIAW